MLRISILALSLGLVLAGCGNTAAQNVACARQARSNLAWGYYPGYGCGPVPPAQTHFS